MHSLVLTMYEQDTKNSAHAHVSSADSLAKLSYIVVQEIEQILATLFTPVIHEQTTPSFHHVPSYRLIQKVGNLEELPKIGPTTMTIMVPRNASETLQRWKEEEERLVPHVLACSKRKPKTAALASAPPKKKVKFSVDV